MAQKPPDLDEFGKPIKVSKPPDLDASGNPISNEPSIDEVLTEAKKSLVNTTPPPKRNDIKEVITSSDEFGAEVEPTTYWGGFFKSIKKDILGATVGNEMLQSAAQPKTLGDFGNLVIPSGVPNATKMIPSGIKSKLGEIAGSLKKSPTTTQTIKTASGETTIKGPSDVVDKIYGPVETPIQFNRKGHTGETGSMQSGVTQPSVSSAPIPKAQKITIKKPTPELVKKAKENGYSFNGEVTDDGGFVMHLDPPSAAPKPKQPILESEVGNTRPNKLGKDIDDKKTSVIAEVANFPRAVLASNDFSAPLRQGIGLIHKKEFWKALPSMFKAWGSEEFFQASQKLIAEKPLFRKRVGPALKDGSGYKELPSFAEDAGLQLTDLHGLNNREEVLMSTWAEKVPGVRRGNRAYVAFLNKLRADTFEALVSDARQIAEVARKTGEARPGFFKEKFSSGVSGGVNNRVGKTINKNIISDLDPMLNGPLAKELANFVNTATGRGSLGKLERSATVLNSTFFAPRLIASRLQMLNPHYYITANPMVRKEALKSLFAITAFGNTITQLGKWAGGTVETDPASSDFGKLKIGNSRLDPYAGFQQYIVAAQRLMPHLGKLGSPTDTGIVPLDELTGFMGHGFGGRMKSTTTGREYSLGAPKFGESSRIDVGERFVRGKLNPILGFAWSLLDKQRELSGEKMDLTNMNPFENSVAQRFIPIIIQDLYEVMKNEPRNAWMLGPAAFGMGHQQYEVKR